MNQRGTFGMLALLGALAALLLIVGLVLLTRQMDHAQASREKALIAAQLDTNIKTSAMSVTSAAKNDEAILRLDHRVDKAWAAETYRHQTGEVWIYTLSGRDQLISGGHLSTFRNGALVRLEHSLPRQVAMLRDRANMASGATVNLFWHEGRLYSLMMAPFKPSTAGLKLKNKRPPVLIAVTPFDIFIRDYLVGTGLSGLNLEPADYAGLGQPLINAFGQQVATMTWRQDHPGADLLRIVMFPALALGGAFAALLIFTLRRAAEEQENLIRSEARANYLALHDQLTGLANRRYLLIELARFVERAQRTGRGCSLLLVDLDGFKSVNDTYGHQSGDDLLVEVSRRLRERCEHGLFCARLGGDEFVILMESDHIAEVMRLAEAILNALASPIELAQAVVQTGGSIGVSQSFGETPAEALMQQADQALYWAKDNGRNCYCFFPLNLEGALLRRA